MSFDETGGPAFPCERQLTDQDVLVFEGITIRDYFAAKAMQSITADQNAIDENTGKKLCLPEDAEQIALASYMMADAMLEARK
jgi:hypothetical protein